MFDVFYFFKKTFVNKSQMAKENIFFGVF